MGSTGSPGVCETTFLGAAALVLVDGWPPFQASGSAERDAAERGRVGPLVLGQYREACVVSGRGACSGRGRGG